MVGAVSTSESLSNKDKYSYFMRVVPSDKYQAQVIIDILLRHNWTYVSAVNSEGGYGEIGMRAVFDLARENGICIAYSRQLRKARGNIEYVETVQQLAKKKHARVVVMFVQVNS